MSSEKTAAVGPILAPVSIGELIDRIAILDIKTQRIGDAAKRANVMKELELLRAIQTAAGLDHPGMVPFADELMAINAALWDIEDEIRELEAHGDFGARFVALARSVYVSNDRRSDVKRRINIAFGSEIIEEKAYKGG